MRRVATSLAFTCSVAIATSGGCKKTQTPTEQCEAIYRNGNGEHAYTTGESTFVLACAHTSDATRACLLAPRPGMDLHASIAHRVERLFKSCGGKIAYTAPGDREPPASDAVMLEMTMLITLGEGEAGSDDASE